MASPSERAVYATMTEPPPSSEMIPTDESVIENAPSLTEPTDKKHLVWLAVCLCGVGFLLPYSTYITAVDYFQEEFQDYSPEFSLSCGYIYTACIMAGVNIACGLERRFSLLNRIRTGYFLFLLPLAFFQPIDELMHAGHLSRYEAFVLFLLSIIVCAIGTAIQQSAFYGLTAMFPERYTVSVMMGESIAGVVISMSRIITKLSYPGSSTGESTDSLRESTFVFLYITIACIVICIFVNEFSFRSDYVRHNTRFSANTNSKPVVQESVGLIRQTSDSDMPSSDNSFRVTSSSVQNLIRLAKKMMYGLMAVALSFCVTLALFPGVAASIESRTWGSWLPILIITAFNIGDLIGKIMPLLSLRVLQPRSWTPFGLVVFTLLRIPLGILILLCAMPAEKPLIRGEWVVIVLNLLLGITGGYSASLAMAIGPSLVEVENKELGGTMMTFALLGGLALGSSLSLAIMPGVAK
eukprot:m.74879 g.74879  ORF g.74879 m.74879 type:complete len:467 (+) comp12482_c0_seq12:270-1670(+)